MRKLKIVFCLLVFSIISFAGALFVHACECPNPGSICDHYARADAVFIGKVEDIKPIEMEFSGKIIAGKKVKIKVNKSYKGANSDFVMVAQPTTSCDWEFEESDKQKEFLFYLDSNKKTGEYKVMKCSRSAGVSNAADDLSWLNGLPKSLERTRFSGVLGHYEHLEKNGVTRLTFIDYLVGTKVSIFDGRKTYTASTDANGMFEFWDVPPGKYRVDPEFPANYRVYIDAPLGRSQYEYLSPGNKDLAIEVPKGGCAGIEYFLKKN